MRYKAVDCGENRKFRIITLIYFFDFSIQFKPGNRSLLNLHLYHNICIYRARRTKAYELKEKRIGSSRRKMCTAFNIPLHSSFEKSPDLSRSVQLLAKLHIWQLLRIYCTRYIKHFGTLVGNTTVTIIPVKFETKPKICAEVARYLMQTYIW